MVDELTPERIAEYPLRHAMRGYRVEQVDGLLDQVADRLERLEGQLTESRRALADAEHRIEDATSTEATLKRTLVTAQRAAEDTVAEAEARAARLVADAEEQAEQILVDARQRAERQDAEAAARLQDADREADRILTTARARVFELRRAAEEFEAALRVHIQGHLDRLDDLPAPPDLPTAPDPADSDQSYPADDPGRDADAAPPPAVWTELFGEARGEGSVGDFHE